MYSIAPRRNTALYCIASRFIALNCIAFTLRFMLRSAAVGMMVALIEAAVLKSNHHHRQQHKQQNAASSCNSENSTTRRASAKVAAVWAIALLAAVAAQAMADHSEQIKQ
jgi:predicted histidine transporter YuiF (NhaC family)